MFIHDGNMKMHLSSSWKDFNQSIITSSHLVCSVFQGPVSGVAQQSERTSSGLRSAGDPGHLQTRTQRDQDMSGCTDNEENSEQNFGTNYSIGFFFRGLSHKFFKPWWPRSSASREGDLRRLPPNRPRLFGSFFFFFSLRAFTFFFLSGDLADFASSTSALPAASVTLHTRAPRKMQTVASFGQKAVLMEDEKTVRLLTEGGKKRPRWKRVDGGGGSLFSLKSVFSKKKGTVHLKIKPIVLLSI